MREEAGMHREAGMHTVDHIVEGMSCAHCERAIVAELEALDGVRAAEADAASGTVRVRSSREIPLEEVREAIGRAGYELAPRP